LLTGLPKIGWAKSNRSIKQGWRKPPEGGILKGYGREEETLLIPIRPNKLLNQRH
jgi:hypothetical protein